MAVGFLVSALLYFAAIMASRGSPLWSEKWVPNAVLAKMTLAYRAPSPRTLVVGGSSGLYGVDAALLSAKSGQPTINLAVHAGVPLVYYLDRCREIWRPGDTMLLHLEFAYWIRPNGNLWQIEQELSWGYLNPEQSWFTSRRLYLLTHVTPDRVLAGLIAKAVPQAYPQVASERFSLPWGGYAWHWGPYDADVYAPLNDHGDRLPLYPSPHPVPIYPYLPNAFDEKGPAMEPLGDFIRDAHTAGVRVFFAFPAAVLSPAEDFRGPEARAWTDHLIAWAEAKGAKVLGRPEDMQLAPELFYDSPYHLTARGRELHTQRLLEQLRAAGWP